MKERKVHAVLPGFTTLTVCGAEWWSHKPSITTDRRKVTCLRCRKILGLVPKSCK